MPAAATLVAIAAVLQTLPLLTATLAVVLLAWLTLGVARVGRRDDVGRLAVAVAAFALAKWLLVDLLGTRYAGVHGIDLARPIVNPLIAAGVVAAASMVGVVIAAGRAIAGSDVIRRQVDRLLAVSVAIAAIAIGLCVEFDPAAATVAHGGSSFRPDQLAGFARTTLLMLVALAAAPLQRWLAPRAFDAARVRAGVAWAIVVLAIKFVLGDALFYASDETFWRPTPLLNVEAGVAAFVVVACAIAARQSAGTVAGRCAAAAVAVVPLVAGSIELSRAVGRDGTLVALSIFWALYAAATIVVGFALRGGWGLRVCGLSLLAITIGKVVLVDLASAGTGWRIVSFLIVGALLLATSVLYGRFGDRLLRRQHEPT